MFGNECPMCFVTKYCSQFPSWGIETWKSLFGLRDIPKCASGIRLAWPSIQNSQKLWSVIYQAKQVLSWQTDNWSCSDTVVPLSRRQDFCHDLTKQMVLILKLLQTNRIYIGLIFFCISSPLVVSCTYCQSMVCTNNDEIFYKMTSGGFAHLPPSA